MNSICACIYSQHTIFFYWMLAVFSTLFWWLLDTHRWKQACVLCWGGDSSFIRRLPKLQPSLVSIHCKGRLFGNITLFPETISKSHHQLGLVQPWYFQLFTNCQRFKRLYFTRLARQECLARACAEQSRFFCHLGLVQLLRRHWKTPMDFRMR